ncbi:hypothetical protein A2U01_0073072, partial [Trifolium medium]|nr:hypothetical protein [Trifolium medium]
CPPCLVVQAVTLRVGLFGLRSCELGSNALASSLRKRGCLADEGCADGLGGDGEVEV